MKKILVLIIIMIFFTTPKAYAALSSCSVSVDPSSLQANATQAFTFTITNSGGATAQWAQFSSNTSNQTLQNGSASGWSTQGDGTTTLTFTNGALDTENSAPFTINVISGSSEMGAQEWTVRLSDASDGSGSIACSGSPSIAIVGNANPAPTISSVNLSNVANSSVTITFDTDVSATSVIDYGTDTSYGSQSIESDSKTNHTHNITGLTANTTYHYQITATNISGSTTTDDATFTTALSSAATSTPGPTSTPIVITNTTTNTTTNTITLPTPTPVPDRSPPTVTVQSPVQTPYKDPPTIRGTAGDNTAVVNTEYSVDSGKSWIRIKDITGINSTFTQFSFTPLLPSGDGTISVLVRAHDSSANIGISKPISFIIDRTGPQTTLTTNLATPYETSPKISGSATDASGESSVNVSIDGGKNWQPADKVTVTGTNTQFEFTPPALDDGDYPIAIQATDPLGNSATAQFPPLIIDRLPPVIGGSLLFVGPLVLHPDAQGFIQTVPNIEHTIAVSVVGGPNEVTLTYADPSGNSQTLPLNKSTSTGLWSTQFLLPAANEYTLSLFAKDGAGHTAQQDVGKLNAIAEGRVTNRVEQPIPSTVTLYVLDKTTGTYIPWDGQSFGQKNPRHLTQDGTFTALLPTGTYYIQMTSNGYITAETNSFSVSGTTPIGPTIKLSQSLSFHLGFFTLTLPSFHHEILNFTPPDNLSTNNVLVSHLNLTFPKIELTAGKDSLSDQTLRGKKTIITILNTWSPQAAGQLSQIERFSQENPDIAVAVIVPEEPISSVALYKRRGGYTVPMFADPDGTMLTTLPYRFAPAHFFFDQSGQSTKQIVGALTDIELNNNIQ